MSITRTILKVRPNTHIPFFKFSNEYKEKIDNNPNINRSHTFVDDLTLETILTFSDQDTFDAFFADPLVIGQLAELEEHCQLADIEKTTTDSASTS
jgi:hypothetical protein